MNDLIKNMYLQPKVEIKLDEYNRLMEQAQLNAEQIEKRARELVEKEGIVDLRFCGYFHKTFGQNEYPRYEFEVGMKEYQVSPCEGDNKFFSIPQQTRERIARKVSRYVEEVFETSFGQHMLNLNEAEKLRERAARERRRFIIWTIGGWLMAIFLSTMILLKG